MKASRFHGNRVNQNVFVAKSFWPKGTNVSQIVWNWNENSRLKKKIANHFSCCQLPASELILHRIRTAVFDGMQSWCKLLFGPPRLRKETEFVWSNKVIIHFRCQTIFIFIGPCSETARAKLISWSDELCRFSNCGVLWVYCASLVSFLWRFQLKIVKPLPLTAQI